MTGALETLREWVAAHDAERATAVAAAKARHKAFEGVPTRVPRNAVFINDLSPEEQRRINDQCAREMAPIDDAEKRHRAARTRLAAAVENARAALAAASGAETGGPAGGEGQR